MKMCRMLLTALLALPLAAQDGAWLGTWRLGSAPDIQAIIEKCTEEMSFIKRPIARARLKKLNPAYQRLVIARSGGDFTLQFDARQPISVPANGGAIPWTREDGEKFRVSVKPQGDVLTQHYQGEDGERSNRFSADAKGLTLEVAVKSQKLPQPLVYRLNYIR